MSKIKFLTTDEFLNVFPHPVKAIKASPDWYKEMPGRRPNTSPNSKTVKRCIPFLDALSSGFIIPLWADMWIKAEDGNLQVEFPNNFTYHSSIESHSFDQVDGYPLSNSKYGKIPLKFVNPWLVQTEPGYSVLFTNPLNHMNDKIKILDGVVDTDTYYNTVNFPFVFTGEDGEYFFEKGTPLVQVIPFKREDYTLEVDVINEEKQKQTLNLLGTRMVDGYKKEFWHNSPTNKKQGGCPVNHSEVSEE